MDQEDILAQILEKNRTLEELQKEINLAVLMNRKAVSLDSSFDRGYTESIESYFTNI